MEDVGRFEVPPQMDERLRGRKEIVASGGQGSAIDRAGRGSSDEGKGIAVGRNLFQFAHAQQNAGLTGASGATARNHQANPVFHLSPPEFDNSPSVR
jgi:hypothetical protein